MSMSENAYAKAGVDVEAGYEAVERMKKHVSRTMRPEVLSGLGGFGGAFDLSKFNYKEPVLISGTDGVGTKLLLAIQSEKYDTIGIDAVAMCVNDIVAQGAEPLFFLDYIALGKSVPEVVEQIVAGVAEGCVQANTAIVGGETAEMPGMYDEKDFDLAGFTVGIAEKSKLINPNNVQEGDLLLGLPSTGVHSNGYSLVRKVFFEDNDFAFEEKPEILKGETIIDTLMTPTKIYVKTLMPLIKEELINGVAHITGGGFVENLPRMFNVDKAASINLGSWPILPVFQAIEHFGKIDHKEMYEIFNMGIGMVLAVSPKNKDRVFQILEEMNEEAYVIGEVKQTTDKQVELIGE